MGLPVGMPVLINGRLNVGVAQLLLDEVDRLASAQPERRRRVVEVVKADGGGEASIIEGVVVASTADVVAVQHLPLGAAED